MFDGKRLACILISLGLLVAIAVSGLRLLELSSIEEGLEAAAHHLALSEVEAAAIALRDISGKSLSETQAATRDDLLPRLLTMGFEMRAPIVSVAGQDFSSSAQPFFRVALRRPTVIIAVDPPALRTWIREIRLGSLVVPISVDEDSHRVRLPAPPGKNTEISIDVLYGASGGEIRGLSLGSFQILVDETPPLVIIGEGESRKTFASSTAEEVQIQVRPGGTPVIHVEDPLGLEIVRWNLDGVQASKTPEGEFRKRLRLPLAEGPFQKRDHDVVLVIIAENELGIANRVKLRFAVRGE